MKKRSILLTCIVAVMALAMFVGCDNAPVLPSFVVSGNITQTGDFLIGQTFDPSKFSVTVTYDNGRIVAADDTVSVVLADGEDSKVEAGTKVEAYIGKNYASENVTATANVRAYAIKSIAVSGPESYAAVKGLSIPASDLTVTATYLDSNNAEKTMVLVPGEYTVDDVKTADTDKLNKVDTTIETSVTVTSQVGNIGTPAVSADFSFTATYVETPEAPEYALETVNGIKYNGMLLNLTYDEIPTPAAEDVVISYYDEAGNYVPDEESDITAADLEGEVVLEFIDANGNPLAYKDLTKTSVSNLDVRMTYDGKVYTDDNANVSGTAVKVVVSPKEGFSVKAGVAIGEPDVNDFFFDLVTTEKAYIERLSANDVDVAYTNANTGDLEDIAYEASTIIKKDSDSVYLYATYMGAEGYTGKLDIEEADPVTVTGITAKLDTEVYKAPAYQNYTDFETALELDKTAVKSVSYMYTAPKKDAKPEVRVVTDLDGRIDVKYTTDTKGTALVAGPDALVGLDTIYIEVTYTPISGTEIVYYEPVKLQTAYATKLVAEVKYTGNLNADDEPMFGANVDVTVNAENENGIVIADIQDYVIVDSATKRPVEAFVSTVDMAEHSYTLNAIVAGEDGETQITTEEDVTISAGEAYYAVTELGIEPAELEGEETAPVYLIDEKLTLEAADFVVTGYIGQGTEAPLTITGFVYTSENVTEGENTVYAKVSYTDESGKTVNELVEFTVEGTSWGEVSGAQLIWADTKEPVTTIEAGTYNIDDFAIKGYTEHGTSPVKISVYAPKDASVTESGNFAVGAYETISFRYSYTDKTGETVGPTQVLEVSATPAN